MVRRKAGEGSLFQRKDGSWVAQYKGQYQYAKDKDTAKQKLYAMLSGAKEESKPSNISVGAGFDPLLRTDQS